jgi:hypothetical protein
LRRERTGAHARAPVRARDRYFVPDDEPVELEPDGELDVVESLDELGGVDGDVTGGGVVVVGGEADGDRSFRRSLTDPVPLSVQPAASVATSATAESPKNARFMSTPPHLSSNRAPCLRTAAGNSNVGATALRPHGSPSSRKM